MSLTLKINKIQLDYIKSLFKKANLKVTHQRLIIYQELLNLGSHPDIECLYVSTKRKLPTISLNTVYRTLRLFITLGIVNALNISHEKTKFDANNTPHNHFVCLNCGNIVDFNCREIENIEIPESVKNEGLVGTRYLEFRGICFKCLNKKQNT